MIDIDRCDVKEDTQEDEQATRMSADWQIEWDRTTKQLRKYKKKLDKIPIVSDPYDRRTKKKILKELEEEGNDEQM